MDLEHAVSAASNKLCRNGLKKKVPVVVLGTESIRVYANILPSLVDLLRESLSSKKIAASIPASVAIRYFEPSNLNRVLRTGTDEYKPRLKRAIGVYTSIDAMDYVACDNRYRRGELYLSFYGLDNLCYAGRLTKSLLGPEVYTFKTSPIEAIIAVAASSVEI